MNVEIYFAIAQHNLTVVGMSGSYVKPILTDVVMISPGQTMDVLVTANQPLGRYYMAARQYDSIRQGVKNYDKVNVTAILEYRGNYTPSVSPSFPNNLPTYADFSPAIEFMKLIRSLANKDHPINVPQNITTRMFVTASENNVLVDLGGENVTALASSLNNISWVNPTTDVLLAYYRYLLITFIFLITFCDSFVFILPKKIPSCKWLCE